MVNQPITLIGMMGSGKSTVGRRLASHLGIDFIDADKELEARCGVPIATIFDLEGEAGFRKRETDLLAELLNAPIRRVVATGGGVVLSEVNRQYLSSMSRCVYLEAQVQDLWIRLRNDRDRPLLRTQNPRARIAELVQLRHPLYVQTAKASVKTSRQGIEKVVGDIIAFLNTVDKHPIT
jgi:shikimate kinase